jgi:hypothetical protein
MRSSSGPREALPLRWCAEGRACRDSVHVGLRRGPARVPPTSSAARPAARSSAARRDPRRCANTKRQEAFPARVGGVSSSGRRSQRRTWLPESPGAGPAPRFMSRGSAVSPAGSIENRLRAEPRWAPRTPWPGARRSWSRAVGGRPARSSPPAGSRAHRCSVEPILGVAAPAGVQGPGSGRGDQQSSVLAT